LVIKFGGTSLKTPALFRRAAEAVGRLLDEGNEIAVVVSAPGRTTDELVGFSSQVGSLDPADPNYVEYLSLGEQQGTYLMAMALEAAGRKAVALTPLNENFPLRCREMPGVKQEISSEKVNDPARAVTDDDASVEACTRHVRPLMSAGVVPVVSGFFVRTVGGKIQALGRGGSDISAFLLGRYLKADEVVIVTDVDGVLSTDPNKVDGAEVIADIAADDLVRLSRSGARVLHQDALRHKTDDMRARIVNFNDLGRLSTSGTSVTGSAATAVKVTSEKLSMVTLMGHKLSKPSGVLAEIGGYFGEQGISVHAMTLNDGFLTIYVEDHLGEEVVKELHNRFVGPEQTFYTISRLPEIGEITLSNHQFVDEPGVISAISHALSRDGVNILEMVTSHTDIVVYVAHGLVDKCAELLKRRLADG